MTQATIRGGRRMSTAVCYLDPARAPAEPDHPGQRADRMPAARRQALRRRALHRATASSARPARAAKSSSAPARSTRRSFWSCPASASRSVLQGARHRGAPRAQGRRREPARSLLAADEMDGAAVARHDLQRQGARPRHGAAGAAIRARPTRGCSACRRRRSAPISAPAPDWTRRTRRSPGSRSWSSDELPAGQDNPASPRS